MSVPISSSHVVVCIPSGEMVHADFMLSVLNLVQQARGDGHRISVVNSKSSIGAEGRSFAVDAALEAQADWLMFLDSDMTFPPSTISRLLAHGKPIVGATYPRRGWPLAFIGTRLDGGTFTLTDPPLVEAARIPTGCLLIQATVFEKLKRPYFRYGYDEEAGVVISEDFWFSDTVRSLSIPLWCDLALSRELAHLGIFRFIHKEPPPQ